MSTNPMNKYFALVASAIAFGASVSAPAVAQDGAKLDEIIVTAPITLCSNCRNHKN